MNTRAPYTHKQLADVKDVAPDFGFAETNESRFPNDDLQTEQTGLSYHRIKPGKRQPFGHRHDEAEDVYVVVAGSGRVKLDDDIVELKPLDAVRVSAGVMRASRPETTASSSSPSALAGLTIAVRSSRAGGTSRRSREIEPPDES